MTLSSSRFLRIAETSMLRRSVIGLWAAIGSGLVALPGLAAAQPSSLKERLVGTWKLSAADARKDGAKVDLWGANPKGQAIFVANGRYSFMLSRADIPRFAIDNREQGTAEEYKAVMYGMIADFGTWSIDEASKTLITNIEASSYPNLIGGSQKRVISSLTADELKYTISSGTTGAVVATEWKRVK